MCLILKSSPLVYVLQRMTEVIKEGMSKRGKGGTIEESALERAKAKRLPPLLQLTEALREHVRVVAEPCSARMIQLKIDLEAEVDDCGEAIRNILGTIGNEDRVQELFGLLKMGEKFALMQRGQCQGLPVISPLKNGLSARDGHVDGSNPPGTGNAPLQTATPDRIIGRNLSSALDAVPGPCPSWQAAAAPENGVEAAGKRKRTPTTRLVDELKQVVGEPTTEELQKKSKKRGNYKMTGIYSRDPIKAALARNKIREGKGVGDNSKNVVEVECEANRTDSEPLSPPSHQPPLCHV